MENYSDNTIQNSTQKLECIGTDKIDSETVEKDYDENDLVGLKLSFAQLFYRLCKRIFDFLIALIGLILVSPIMIITAIAIKIDSKGPVFFKQKRIGLNNKDFTCLKFRSMSLDANHEIAGYEYKGAADHITRVGKFIRKTSIDELPQLFCLLIGTMSLIGYRPSQRNEQELIDGREKYGVYQVRPGISGWAQVNGRDILAANPSKKAKFDAYYVKHFGLWMDIKIFFMTIVKVFKSDGVREGEIK